MLTLFALKKGSKIVNGNNIQFAAARIAKNKNVSDIDCVRFCALCLQIFSSPRDGAHVQRAGAAGPLDVREQQRGGPARVGRARGNAPLPAPASRLQQVNPFCLASRARGGHRRVSPPSALGTLPFYVNVCAKVQSVCVRASERKSVLVSARECMPHAYTPENNAV